MGFFTNDDEVIRVGLGYLRVDSLILPLYMMLHSINAFLQAMKRPIWSVWISLYRQAFGVAFFVWLFIGVWGFSEIGVWFGVAGAVVTGWMMAVMIVSHVAKHEIGGLRRGPEMGRTD
jgi:Na+-driven multidrug efflux pump